MNTHGCVLTFGKYEGELLTRVPSGYLRWAVNEACDGQVQDQSKRRRPLHELAQAELDRRGERIGSVEISGHAIDRISLRAMEHYKRTRRDNEGLYSWAERTADSLIRNNQNVPKRGETTIEIRAHGHRWVFKIDLAVPTLLTVK